MELDFWHDKWVKNEVGFHLDAPHSWLVKAVEDLDVSKGQTAFVPLCGKTHDIDFLLQQGLSVVANELSELAVDALFSRLKLQPTITSWSTGKRYQSKQLTVFAGDFFQLTADDLFNVYQTPIHWVYDRAALVALPLPMRKQYCQSLVDLCPQAKQILMTLDYDQTQMPGPPFSVTPQEVNEHYEASYAVDSLHQQNIIEKEPRFKQRGLTAFHQRLYLLTPR